MGSHLAFQSRVCHMRINLQNKNYDDAIV